MNQYAHLIAALGLFALTACSPFGKHLMGDPRNPYPLQDPPKIGDIVHMPTGTLVSQAQMFAVAGDARIVYLGETHDNPASHRLEVQLLEALAERHPGRQALGMEMFSRDQQPVLDRWVQGLLDEKTFLRESRWFENWSMDFDYYRDLLNLRPRATHPHHRPERGKETWWRPCAARPRISSAPRIGPGCPNST